MRATLVKHYDYIFKELADARVENWLFMNGPWPIIAISILYLYAIYVYLPNYMKHRKPYKLKTVLKLYNILQIVACTILIYGVSTSGWTTHYSLGCQPIDYSNDKLAVRMLEYVWWTLILKMIELVETIFFVLRKKYSQVSKLHVYHHVSTFWLAWFLAKYIGGGMATFPIIINSFIHVLMYSYYLLASFGPQMQRKLEPWKPRLTMLQMIQFFILVAHALQSLEPSCKVAKQVLLIWVPNVATNFVMFYNFYKERYNKPKTAEVKKN